MCGQQDVGRLGAFSCAFLARFRPVLARRGAWAYRRLHWECGALAQVCYLECERSGLAGTAMGFFFAEEVHKLVGARGGDFEVLLMFGGGVPTHDGRVQSHPPYGHLKRGRKEKKAKGGVRKK